eukprot:6586202-Pyramimonas_sp.AAC.1
MIVGQRSGKRGSASHIANTSISLRINWSSNNKNERGLTQSTPSPTVRPNERQACRTLSTVGRGRSELFASACC